MMSLLRVLAVLGVLVAPLGVAAQASANSCSDNPSCCPRDNSCRNKPPQMGGNCHVGTVRIPCNAGDVIVDGDPW
jgi:hypothetical protein